MDKPQKIGSAVPFGEGPAPDSPNCDRDLTQSVDGQYDLLLLPAHKPSLELTRRWGAGMTDVCKLAGRFQTQLDHFSRDGTISPRTIIQTTLESTISRLTLMKTGGDLSWARISRARGARRFKIRVTEYGQGMTRQKIDQRQTSLP